MTNKNTQPDLKPLHIGRPEIEGKEPKVVAREVAIHEGNRAFGEMLKAGVADLIVDYVKDKIEKIPDVVFVKQQLLFLVKFAEFRNEHTTEQLQGLEHKDNMLVIIRQSLGMYRATREAAIPESNTDTKKLDWNIGVLEYMEAVQTGDGEKLKTLTEKHPTIAKFVKGIIVKNAKETGVLAKTITLEMLDVYPFASPESVMEVVRMAELQLVSAIFNQHPDVDKSERIPLTKGGIINALKLQAQRMNEARKSFSFWESGSALMEAYKKFLTTGKFV